MLHPAIPMHSISLHGFRPHSTWTVPDDIKLGEYSILATSISNPNVHGYTDVVAVKKASSKRAH